MSRRLSDDEITAVLRGATSPDREVATLGAAVGGVRTAFELRPEPSAQLEAFFDGRLSLDAQDLETAWVGEVAERQTERPRSRRSLVKWVAALGLTAQLGLGSAVAVAATTGAGAAGLLPEPAQRAFDQVVAALTPAGPAATPSELAPLPDAPRPAVLTDGIDDRLARDDATVEPDDIERDTDSDGKRGDRRSGPSPEQVDDERQAEARDAQEDAADDARDAREEAEDRERDAKDDARDARDAWEDKADRDKDRADDAADAEEDLADQAADDAEEAGEDD